MVSYHPLATDGWHMPRIFNTVSLMLLTLSAMLAGCQREPPRSVAVFPVGGQLFVEDEPAEGAIVTFHRVEDEEFMEVATSVVQIDGNFAPVQADGAIGLPLGDYVVTAVWNDESGDDRWEGQYAAPEQPLRRLTVGESLYILPRISLPAMK